MENIVHMMGDKECEDFLKMHIDKPWLCFHQNLFQHEKRLFNRNIHLSHIMQLVLEGTSTAIATYCA